MRSQRFFAAFFSVLLFVSMLVPAAIAADGDIGDWEVAAKASLLADPDTGEILYAKNIHERLYPASLTKVMTGLLVFEAIDRGELSLDTELTASESAIANLPPDGSNAGIKVGESLTVEHLLHCILVVSANEACDILAEGVSGSVDAFVELMNRRAGELGCEDTHFVNTNGLQHIDHYTTAYDMYLIAREAWGHKGFMQICKNKYVELPETALSKARKYYTTNYLISTQRNDKYLYKGANGMKTGSTSDAGYCLIATATRNDRSLLSVVMGADRVQLEDGTKDTRSFSETIRLLDWGFDTFTRQVILSTDELLDEVPVALSQEQNTVKIHPAEEIQRLIPNDVDIHTGIRREIEKMESVDAPVERGQVLGTVTLRRGDTVYGTVDLLADEDVASSRLLVFKRDAKNFIRQPKVIWTAVGIVAAIVLLIVLRLVFHNRKRRYGRSHSRRQVGGYKGRRY